VTVVEGQAPAEATAAARVAFELRKRRRGSMIRQFERRALPFAAGHVELRARPSGHGTTNYEFNGYAVAYMQPFEMWDPWGDEYTENVPNGACTATLAANPDTPFLIGHNDGGISLARTKSGTMRLFEDSAGLGVNVPDLDGRSPLVQSLASAVERGDMDEMSVGFVCRRQMWSPDYAQRDILEMDIHRGDVSVVCLAANPATAGSTMIALSSGRPREKRAPTQPYTAHAGEKNECVQCKSVNDDTAGFCDQCGTQMQPKGYASNMAGVEDMTQACGCCGKWNSADAKFCGGCGRNLTGEGGGSYYWKDGRPLEQLARGEISDSNSQPDFNLPAGTPAYNASAHGDNSLACPDNDCPVYAAGDGDRALNAKDAKNCDQCGAPLYNADGLIVADDNGVVEEVGGDLSDADLLSMRLHLLELA
jgi:HK97 family phage prohead protease